ncbi:MAG: hypothetical protein DDT27_00769 [Dehalococcoidia bacterium]|nr:hypothetical protein [Chloroflexota bacterium]MBT9162223.1 hypothetical protein [Chloroflexota bacterium]
MRNDLEEAVLIPYNPVIADDAGFFHAKYIPQVQTLGHRVMKVYWARRLNRELVIECFHIICHKRIGRQDTPDTLQPKFLHQAILIHPMLSFHSSLLPVGKSHR